MSIKALHKMLVKLTPGLDEPTNFLRGQVRVGSQYNGRTYILLWMRFNKIVQLESLGLVVNLEYGVLKKRESRIENSRTGSYYFL
jgi:hypothetical protein